MLKQVIVLMLAGFVAFLTPFTRSGGDTIAATNDEGPLLICTGDSLRFPGDIAKTCVESASSEGMSYHWSGAGLVNGERNPCAEWKLPGPKYVFVINQRTGEKSVCTATILSDGFRFSGVPIIPDVPRPLMAHNPDVQESITGDALRSAPARLDGIYPNPFNPSTVIRYSLLVESHVHVRIYNAVGQEIAIFEDGFRPAGIHTHTWDASAFPAGLYIVHLDAIDGVHPSSILMETRKILLVK